MEVSGVAIPTGQPVRSGTLTPVSIISIKLTFQLTLQLHNLFLSPTRRCKLQQFMAQLGNLLWNNAKGVNAPLP